MDSMSEIVFLLSKTAPSAFIGMVIAIVVVYLSAKVRLVEARKVRELEQSRIEELQNEVQHLREQLKAKDAKIEALHDQLLEIIKTKSSAGENND